MFSGEKGGKGCRGAVVRKGLAMKATFEERCKL